MGTPLHLPHPKSRFYTDETSLTHRASRLVAGIFPHPQRTLLGIFIQEATEPEAAAQYLLEELAGSTKTESHDILADWIALLDKIRPPRCDDLDHSLQAIVRQRDGNISCISEERETDDSDQENLDSVIVRILPSLHPNDDLHNSNGRMHRMLIVYLGEAKARCVLTMRDKACISAKEDSAHYMLLNSRLSNQFRNGQLALDGISQPAGENWARYFPKNHHVVPGAFVRVFYHLDLLNRASNLARLPDPDLLAVHCQFAKALAWLEAYRYMQQKSTFGDASSTKPIKTMQRPKTWLQWISGAASSIFYSLWLKLPTKIRSFAYARLAETSMRYYPQTGSDSTFQLPFNLYLRKGSSSWAPRYEAELHTFRMLENHTQIPAPKGLDMVSNEDSSFLLMTAVPGEMIGTRLATMTDEQVQDVTRDLKTYTDQLRRIPKPLHSKIQICNSLGDGILDWKIGDSRREVMRFENEDDFHKRLTYDLPFDDEAQRKISTAYSIRHDIVFTHADLNMRNILVDETGRISGIVDWECAGWYPEYWEYTKMHFGCRFSKRWILDVIDQVFDCYHDELAVEDMLAAMVPPW